MDKETKDYIAEVSAGIASQIHLLNMSVERLIRQRPPMMYKHDKSICTMSGEAFVKKDALVIQHWYGHTECIELSFSEQIERDEFWRHLEMQCFIAYNPENKAGE